jgi:hypothetical protein
VPGLGEVALQKLHAGNLVTHALLGVLGQVLAEGASPASSWLRALRCSRP